MSLKRSLAISYAEKYALLLINFVSSLVIARLLSPHEIGIFSVGAFLVGLAHTLRDLGVSNYIVQEHELTTARLRSAQLVTLVMGWSMAALLYCASGPLGRFYDQPEVMETTLVLATSFVFLPFGSVTASLLRRDLRFGALSIIQVVAAMLQAVTAILLAALGYGAISLAWGGVAGALGTTLIAAIYRPHYQPWLPGYAELRRVLDKGGKFSAAAIVFDIGVGGPEVITARATSFYDAGLLSRAQGTVSMLNRFLTDAIGAVMVAHFARLIRSDLLQMRGEFTSSLRNLTSVTWPAFIVLAIVAPDVIRILYGPTWIGASTAAQVLCLSGALSAGSSLASAVVIGAGMATLSLWLQVGFQTVRLTFSLLGTTGGVVGVAVGMATADLLGTLLYIGTVSGRLKIPWRELVQSIRWPAVLAILVGVITLFVHSALESAPPIGRLAVVGLVAITVWLFAIWKSRHPLWQMVLLALAAVRNLTGVAK